MKYQRILFLVIAIGVVSCGSDDDDSRLSGRYTGSQTFGIGQVSSTFILDILQNGNSVTGSVTPPFSTQLVGITNGSISASTLQFDRSDGTITFRYVATVQTNGSQISLNGSFDPLGCLQPSSGEPCPTDSSGNFTASKQ